MASFHVRFRAASGSDTGVPVLTSRAGSRPAPALGASTIARHHAVRGNSWRCGATCLAYCNPWHFDPLKEGPILPQEEGIPWLLIYICFPSCWLHVSFPFMVPSCWPSSPSHRLAGQPSPACPAPCTSLCGAVKLLLKKGSRLSALQGKREAPTVRESWIKWFVSNFLLLLFCWAKEWIQKSYSCLQRMCFYILLWL